MRNQNQGGPGSNAALKQKRWGKNIQQVDQFLGQVASKPS